MRGIEREEGEARRKCVGDEGRENKEVNRD